MKKKIDREELKQKIYQLNWIKILDEAIKGRPTSWVKYPVYEYRNASDEILMALIRHMEEAGILERFSDTIKRDFNKLKRSSS